jgi:hypothetical protein
MTKGKQIEIWTTEVTTAEKAALPTLGRVTFERVSVDMSVLRDN